VKKPTGKGEFRGTPINGIPKAENEETALQELRNKPPSLNNRFIIVLNPYGFDCLYFTDTLICIGIIVEDPTAPPDSEDALCADLAMKSRTALLYSPAREP